MKNLNSIISLHNKSLLKKQKQDVQLCNSRNQINCPLQGMYLTKSIIYQAIVKYKENVKFYIGHSETACKERYRNQIKDFNSIKYRNNTELPKFIWKLKEENKKFTVNWKILKRIKQCTDNGKWNLCLNEKLLIINSIHDENLLNIRSELVSK